MATPTIKILAIGMCGSALGAAWLIAAFNLKPVPGYSFMGFSGSPAARIMSRLVIDHADSAFHGGATHDVRFNPETRLGRMILEVSQGRGEAGQPRGDTQGRDAYSRNVGKWVRISRGLDPGNFDALLTECHYLSEGSFAVDIEHDEEERVSENWSEVASGNGRGGEESKQKEIARAIRSFFKTAAFDDKASLYNAAIAVQMLSEVEPWAFGVRESQRSNKVLSLVDLFIENGDRCSVTWGAPEDAKAARKFAVAVRETIRESMESEILEKDEKSPFTNAEPSRIIWHQ